MSRYLTVKEAARRMKVSAETVRELCRQGHLPGSMQQRSNGPWQIPETAVESWASDPSNPLTPSTEGFEPTPQPRRRFRQHPVIYFSTIVLTGLLALIPIANGVVSLGLNMDNAIEAVQRWLGLGQPAQIQPATPDEVLILVAPFERLEGVADSEAHQEIRRAILRAAQELHIQGLRVEVNPAPLPSEEPQKAEEAGQKYNAAMVIWGKETAVRVTVHYLHLKEPEFAVKEHTIEATGDVATPEKYNSFITEDLPSQLTFLSLFAVGHSYYVRQDYANAARTLQRATELVSEQDTIAGLVEAYFRLGWLYQAIQGDLDRAIAAYSRALELDPNTIAAYNNRASAYADQGESGQAIADYTRAIELDPGFALAYKNRGLARYDQGALVQAIADFDKALELDPHDAKTYYNRGLAQYDQGKLAQAAVDYGKAIELDPAFANAYGNRGLVRYDQGAWDQAIEDFDKAIELDSDNAKLYDNRALAYYQRGDWSKAVADSTKAIELDPGDVEAHKNLANVHYQQRNWAQAISNYGKALELDSKDADTYYNRGNVYYQQEQLDQAISDYTAAIDLDPTALAAYYNRGLAFYQLNKLTEAIADFDQVIQLNPKLAFAYYNRATAHVDQGQLAKAKEDVGLAIELDPGQASFFCLRGRIDKESGDTALADEDFKKALELDPSLNCEREEG